MKHTPRLRLPDFELNPAAILTRGREALKTAKESLLKIGAQDRSKVNFESTLGAVDALRFQSGHDHARIYFLQNVHPDKSIREAAQEIHQEWQKFGVDFTYDENLYAVIRAFADTKPKLEGEEKKYLEETMRSYRRMGFELEPQRREEVKKLFQELHRIESEFSKEIQEYRDSIIVDERDLKGLDAGFISNLPAPTPGKRELSLDYPVYLPVMEFCEVEQTRRTMTERKYRTAIGKNSQHLNRMIEMRKEIAGVLGYASWNHFVMEERMAKDPSRVHDFLEDLEKQLRKQATKDFETLAQLKREHSANPNAELYIWDFYFYSSLLQKKKFLVDNQEIRHYFSLDQVLSGMFGLFKDLFGIEMIEQDPKTFYRWHDDVRLFLVKDEDGQGLGHFYLDLHPREGKYNHAAAFGITDGKLLANGEYQRPVKAMVCNFARATGNEPALIPHREVETLFHEFGHILHGILTQAKFCNFSGTSVAWDFVEAPSQILENWVWDYESLSRFAKDWRQNGKTIPKDLVEKMNAAKKAGSVLHYLRQVSLARADITIHGERLPGDAIDATNKVISEIFLPVPNGSAFAAGWGHMVGYAGGYYGYAWADVMACDLFSRFKKEGVLNANLGRKLRKEIYEPGGSRDENISLEAFLGRPLSNQAFFEDLGIHSR